MRLRIVVVKVPQKRKSKLNPYRPFIVNWISDHSGLTLAELCACLNDNHGLCVGSSTLDDWLRANQITYKKAHMPVDMTAPWVPDGPMDDPAFITYIKTQWAPPPQTDLAKRRWCGDG